jgi:hypothetical protein
LGGGGEHISGQNVDFRERPAMTQSILGFNKQDVLCVDEKKRAAEVRALYASRSARTPMHGLFDDLGP